MKGVLLLTIIFIISLLFCWRQFRQFFLKSCLKLGVLLIIGCILLLLINAAGSILDFKIALNPVTALVAGWGQLPGMVLLTVLTLMF